MQTIHVQVVLGYSNAEANWRNKAVDTVLHGVGDKQSVRQALCE